VKLRILLTILACLLVAGAPGRAEDAPRSEGKVTIPLTEFLELTQNRPGPSSAPRPQAPVGCSLAHGDYQVRVQGDWARVQGALTLRQLKGSWQEVPLLPTDVVVQEARLDGVPVALYPKDGLYHCMVRKVGRHRLELLYHLPVQDSPPSRSLSLKTPATEVSTLTLVVPGGRARISASPGIPLQGNLEGDRMVARGALPAGPETPVTLTWLPLQADPRLRGQVTREKARLYGRLYQLVTVSEKALQCRTRVDFSILGNEVTGWRLALPSQAEVLSVQCPNLDSWRTEDRPQGRTLLVSISQPASGDVSLEITTETPVQDLKAPWNLPFVYIEGAERVKGSVGVCSSGGIEVLPRDNLQEARRIDVQQDLPAEVHAMATSPVLLAYEYHRQPYHVELESRKGEEVAVLDATVDSGQGRTLLTEQGKAVSICTWLVRNNSRQSLLVALPEGAEVWSAFVDGRPARPTQEADGRLRLPLVVSQGTGQQPGTFPVTLTWARQVAGEGPMGRVTILSPRVDVPISELTWQLYLPEDRQILHLGGTMAPLQQSAREDSDGFLPALLGRKLEASAPSPSEEGGMDSGGAGSGPAPDLVQARVRGVFPIQAQVPRVGRVLTFHRLMVSGDEAPSMVVTSAEGWLAGAFGWLVFGLTLMLGAPRMPGPNGGKLLAWGWAGLVTAGVLLGETGLAEVLDGLGRALWLLTLLWGLLRVRHLGAWWAERRRRRGEATHGPAVTEGPGPAEPASELEEA